MSYNPIPFRPGMTEEENDNRNSLNEFRFIKHCIDGTYDTITELQDRLARAQEQLVSYQEDADWQYARLVEKGLIEEGEEV